MRSSAGPITLFEILTLDHGIAWGHSHQLYINRTWFPPRGPGGIAEMTAWGS